MTNKKDFLMAGIAGFLTALFIVPTLKNIRAGFFGYLAVGLIIGLPILWSIAIIVGRFLARFMAWIYQFVKFVIVGFLNATIDFGVLNLLSLYTGLTSGFIIGGVNVPGVIIAATNSYFWNKFWVFAKGKEEKTGGGYAEIITFIFVIIIGVVINSGIVILISTYIKPMFGMSGERWLNIAKVVASAISLAWNFLGFKFIVFKSKPQAASEQVIS